MRRPVLIHGRDGELVRRLGRHLATELGVEFLDLVGASWQTASEALGRAGNCVGVLLSELLLDRPRRVEVVSVATVVAVEPGITFDGALKGVGRLEELVGGEYRECHARFDSGEPESGIVERIRELVRSEPVAVVAGDKSY